MYFGNSFLYPLEIAGSYCDNFSFFHWVFLERPKKSMFKKSQFFWKEKSFFELDTGLITC